MNLTQILDVNIQTFSKGCPLKPNFKHSSYSIYMNYPKGVVITATENKQVAILSAWLDKHNNPICYRVIPVKIAEEFFLNAINNGLMGVSKDFADQLLFEYKSIAY